MIRLLILTISILGISIGSANADPKKVGFIYIGPPGDHGWTYMHDVGRQYMESQLGDAVTSTYIENVPENAVMVGIPAKNVGTATEEFKPYAVTDESKEN